MQSIAPTIKLELLADDISIKGVRKNPGDVVEVSRSAAKSLLAAKKAVIWTTERAAKSAATAPEAGGEAEAEPDHEHQEPLDEAGGADYSAEVPAVQEPVEAESVAPAGRAAKRIQRTK